MNSFTAQFSNFREIPIANERKIYVMIENKNAETPVEWAKCFLCQKDTAKLSFHLTKYVQSSRNWQILQQLTKLHLIVFELNQSRKKALNQLSKTTT